MLALPYPQLSQGTYFDENALQPAQVYLLACLTRKYDDPGQYVLELGRRIHRRPFSRAAGTTAGQKFN